MTEEYDRFEELAREVVNAPKPAQPSAEPAGEPADEHAGREDES
jgi:hypothetical protein